MDDLEPPKLEPEQSDAQEVKSKKEAQNIKMLSIGLVAVLLITVFIQLFGSSFTGHVVADIDRISLGEMAYKDSIHLLSSNDTITMKSAKISGTILGNGSVKVYLASGNDKKLVYSNVKQDSWIPLITGFAVHKANDDTKRSGPYLATNLDNIKLNGENNNILSGIQLQYQGNEQGMLIEKIKITWLPDNGEQIIGIKLGDADFWGYERAGSPSGKQKSGTLLNGWGQKLANNAIKEINAIEFDSNMGDKEVIIEISYNDYVAGFQLGHERLLKIYLDLSGKKESYVEEDGQGRQTFIVDRIQRPDTKSDIKGSSSGSSGGIDIDKKPISGTQTKSQFVPLNIPELAQLKFEAAQEYPGYQIASLPDGRIVKKKELSSNNVFLKDKPSAKVEFRTVENPVYKEIFEERMNTKIKYTQVNSQCDETCILDVINQNEYTFVFEMEEGIAFNVTGIEFT